MKSKLKLKQVYDIIYMLMEKNIGKKIIHEENKLRQNKLRKINYAKKATLFVNRVFYQSKVTRIPYLYNNVD